LPRRDQENPGKPRKEKKQELLTIVPEQTRAEGLKFALLTPERKKIKNYAKIS